MAPRIRLAVPLLAAAALAAAPALAQGLVAGSTTTGSTSVSDPAAITVTQNLSFTLLPQTLNTGLTITSSAINGVDANVVLTGGQTTSVSVPATFDVTRVGGDETITVRTVGPVTDVASANGAGQAQGAANGGVFSNPVTVIGALDAGMLSFSVAGQVTVGNNLVPGQYEGVLTVIAQYN